MTSIHMLIYEHLISEDIQCLVIQLQMNDSINSTSRIENKTTKRKSSLKPNTNSTLNIQWNMHTYQHSNSSKTTVTFKYFDP